MKKWVSKHFGEEEEEIQLDRFWETVQRTYKAVYRHNNCIVVKDDNLNVSFFFNEEGRLTDFTIYVIMD